jgi:hypothetical protein
MKTTNIPLGLAIMLVLCVFFVPFFVVVSGLLRIAILRLRGLTLLQQVKEKSFRDFFSSLKQCFRPFSATSILKLIFYNPRGGVVFLILLLPVVFIACAIIGVVAMAL